MAVFVFLSLFLPGYVILKRYSSLDGEERLAASFGMTSLMYAILGTALASPQLQFLISPALVVILLLCLAVFVFSRMDRDLTSTDKHGLWSCLALWLATLFFVSLPILGSWDLIQGIPGPLNVRIQYYLRTPAMDNYIPYRVAQFLANGMPQIDFIGPVWGFFDRTPLMGLVAFFLLKGVNLPISLGLEADQGLSYPMFQMIGSLLNSLLLLGSYLALKRMFNGYVAQVSSGFLLVSTYVFFNTLFTWPKSLVGYFVLLSWYFLMQGKRPFLAGLFAGLAYLSHDLGAIYLAGAFLYLLLARHRSKPEILRFMLPVLALIAPWLTLSRLLSNHLSLFFLYIISVQGLPNSRDVQPLLAAFLATPLARIIWIRVVNLYLLLFPWPLGAYDPNTPLVNTFNALAFFPLAGAAGIFLFAFSYYGIARDLLRRAREIVCFIVVPLALILLIQGWPGPGLGAMHFAEPLVPLLTGFAVLVLSARRKLTLALFSLQLCVYVLLLGWSYGQQLFLGWQLKDYLAFGSLALVTGLACLRMIHDVCGVIRSPFFQESLRFRTWRNRIRQIVLSSPRSD
jgi:hypothetical protein